MSKINFHNCDCMEFMRNVPDRFYDLAIVDPPYGMMGNTFTATKGTKSIIRLDKGGSVGLSLGNRPDKEYFDNLFRISNNQIIFGMQYFVNHLIPHQCVIVWDKQNGRNRFSDAEIAYTSFDTAVRCINRYNPNINRIHPTQKPIDLYRWILQNYAKQGDKIFDSHGGSMSIAIACDMEGFDLDICEMDKKYFDAAVKRFNDYKSQLSLL